MKIIVNDCVEAMRAMEENSVDAIVTDPPYGLEFMGKDWDKLSAPDATTLANPADAGGFQDGAGGNPYSRGRVRHGKKASSMAMVAWHENWAREALRILKPGGHLLVFGGSRTYHSMAMGVELAGFEIRDQIQWVYGQGFPKSMNVGKAIDKAGGDPNRILKFCRWFREAGLPRKRLDHVLQTSGAITENGTMAGHYYAKDHGGQPAIPTAAIWAVMRPHIDVDIPAWVDELVDRIEAEREVVGSRKGIDMKKQRPVSVAAQGLDGSTSTDVDITAPATPAAKQWDGWGTALKPAHEPIVMARKPFKGSVASNVLEHGTAAINIDGCRVGGADGRWPANFIHDGSDEVVSEFPGHHGYGNGKSEARFFYCAKPSKAEKNAGLGEDFETKQTTGGGGTNHEELGGKFGSIKAPAKNHHPTVKPVALMAYLCRLVTPPGGTVLDPFTGSGTTGVAAVSEGFDFIGIEREAEYAAIAEARITNELEASE